jgi:hypothetical protein
MNATINSALPSDGGRAPIMNNTILEVVVGSTVHGTSVDDGLEDLDLMAIRLESKAQFVGFCVEDTWTKRTKPDGVRSEAGDVDYVAYGLRKYLSLALRGNPTILLALFVPDDQVRHISPPGAALRALAPAIVSKQVFAPFRGYMKQQHERLMAIRGQRNVTRPELIERYGYDTKYAGHIIRLGLQGEEILASGRISLPMPAADRQLVVDVRTGKYTLNQVSDMIVDVERRLEVAKDASTLPEQPNRAKVEAWMVEAYLKHWGSPKNEAPTPGYSTGDPAPHSRGDGAWEMRADHRAAEMQVRKLGRESGAVTTETRYEFIELSNGRRIPSRVVRELKIQLPHGSYPTHGRYARMDCASCGAPPEPHRCSYCLTPTQMR